MSLADEGRQVLDVVRKAAPAAQAEAFVMTSQSRSQEWSEGKPENHAANRSRGAGLRVIDGGRLGFCSTNRNDADAVAWLGNSALEASRITAPDPFLELPKPVTGGAAPDLQLIDPVLMDDGFEKRAAFLSAVETEVKKHDKRITKVLRASYRESRHESAVASTTGVAASDAGTSASFSLACVAVEGSETQVGYGFQAATHHADLKMDWVVKNTIENTLALLGGKQVPSGRYDLILDPLVAAEMLELLSGAVRGDQVLKGRSFLAKHLGKKIGADCLTIMDDGRLTRGLGSSLVDAEGIPTQTTVVMKDGVLENFLYDSSSARRAKKTSTGNAGRGSYKGLPEPGSTNFYIKAGATAPEKLIGGIKSGLYIRNVMGLHTVDQVSGDYSLGIMGEHIENGKRTHGVRGITIAGNLLELLRDVAGAANDLVFWGSVGSPTLWIQNVSVGGS